MAELINLYILPGLTVGSIYALGAAGISLLFGILRFAHFAHGDMMTLGAYIALSLVTLLGLPVYGAIFVAIPATALVAVLIDRFFYRPLRKQPPIMTVIASFGIMLMIRSAVQLMWGVDVLSYERGVVSPLNMLWGIKIGVKQAIILWVSCMLAFALHLFLSKTRIGKAMRAISDDADLARVSGIDAESIVRWTWTIGGGLAAIAGIFLGINTKIHPNMGWDLLLPLFAAAILGGIGRPLGAVLGGLTLGLIQEMATYPWLSDMPLISPSYKSGIAFLLMIGMLLWRPSGLLKGRSF